MIGELLQQSRLTGVAALVTHTARLLVVATSGSGHHC